MISIEIPFDPVPWAAPRLSRHGCYDPREKDKRVIRYRIKEKYKGLPIEDYVLLRFFFTFSIPKSASKAKRQQMLDGDIIPTKCDCTNLQKLYEDCLKGIVIHDDRNVMFVSSSKEYGSRGHVWIWVMKAGEEIKPQNLPFFGCRKAPCRS